MYVNHKAYQWNEVMQAANGGVVLRSEFIYADYTLVMEFDEITPALVGVPKVSNEKIMNIKLFLGVTDQLFPSKQNQF